MKYSKDITIRQIMFKYKVTKQQAENMYREFEQSGDVDTLASVIFKPEAPIINEPAALSY